MDARSDIGLFVELLVFAALAFALVLIPLMRSMWHHSPAADHGTADETAPLEVDNMQDPLEGGDLSQPLLPTMSHIRHGQYGKVR